MTTEKDYQNEHTDPTRFPTMNSRNFILGGIIVILGLVFGGMILAYNISYNETKRNDSVPQSASQPIKPIKPAH